MLQLVDEAKAQGKTVHVVTRANLRELYGDYLNDVAIEDIEHFLDRMAQPVTFYRPTVAPPKPEKP